MKHIQIFESFNNPQRKAFTEGEINAMSRMWGRLNVKYTNNPFFSSLWNQVLSKKSLSQKQWLELDFLLKNGKSRYESGQIPKNY